MALSSPTYPVALVLRNRPCVVVGGGRVASRKVDGLLAAHAAVTVVAPDVLEEIATRPVRVERRPYRSGEAGSYVLALAATGVRDVDRRVAADAERAGVPVNVADDPESCTFVLPAILRRGPVSVAVSSGGTSPALASWLRDRVAGLVGPDVALLAAVLGEARASWRAAGRSSEDLAWRDLLDGPLPGLVASGELDRARAALATWAASHPPGAASRRAAARTAP
nr:bifunctional precorrin-2 dehydrogenase/sirohydrochlorin ferrochelatase [Actinomycetota bacterium]